MKRVIIVHAWGSSPEEHWYKEEKKQLEVMEFEALLPQFPGGDWPKLEDWLTVIENLKPDEETILIGHSLGVPAILRYLEKSAQKVDKIFLIAGFAEDLRIEETKNFVADPFDWEKIVKSANKFKVINQVDDPWVPIAVGQEMADNLGVEIVKVEGNNHFDTMDLDLINRELK